MITESNNSFSVFFIPSPSPWPILIRFRIFNIFSVILGWSEGIVHIAVILLFLLIILVTMFLWLRDVSWESGSIGFSSFEFDNTLKVSMLWFISREVMFFFSFFFSYISLRRCTEISTGTNWPPVHLDSIPAYSVPLLNTIILLSRGISLTWAHHMLIRGQWRGARLALAITIFLALSFTLLQLMEYYEIRFSINDSFFGRIFFMGTGFHGIHVILGTVILRTAYLRIIGVSPHRTKSHPFFEIRSWYWHFVDVVWLFLYLIMYINLV